jgi:hypothetical protein
MPPSLQPPNTGENSLTTSPATKIIQGKYVNPEFGLELLLPDNVVGTEAYVGAYVIVTLDAYSLGIEGPIEILMMNSSGTGINNVTARVLNMTVADPINCHVGKTVITIGGKHTRVSDEPCSSMGMKIRNYSVDVGADKAVLIRLQNPPTPTYDSSVAAFDKFVKTVKFTQ